MSNHITIELCAEDRKRIDELICFAGLIVGEQKQYRQFMTGLVTTKAPEPAAPEINHPADILPPHGEPEPAVEPVAEPAVEPVAEPAEEPVAEPAEEPELPKYTKDDVLAKVQSLAGPNNPKREQAKAIVKSYGAKVSDIPVDKYTEVMAKLAELEG